MKYTPTIELLYEGVPNVLIDIHDVEKFDNSTAVLL